MQAIARVNRVWGSKPGGLVVDYLGLAEELRQALATYTEAGGTGRTAIDQAEAVDVMLAKYEVYLGLFHGFEWRGWTSGSAVQQMKLMAGAVNHILGLPEGKGRLLQAVTELSASFALAVPHEQALAIRDNVGFFQAVRAALVKPVGGGDRKSDWEIEQGIRQIIRARWCPTRW